MLVELSNISRVFEKQTVLDDLSWSLDAGQRAAIIGPSGSGKSTLLNILGLLDTQDTGVYRFDGKDTASLDPRTQAGIRAQSIGFVFQLHHLLPHLSALENTLVPVHALPDKPDWNAAESRARSLLDKIGLKDHFDKLPGQLSGGERQRVAVVRSLINRPRLLLADEPTGALDQENAHMLIDLLCSIGDEEKVALVVVTHDQAMAGRIGSVHHLANGQLHSKTSS